MRVANRCLDNVRRWVQNETLGHRGRKYDPLYRIRKIMLTRHERLDDRGRQRMLLGLRAGEPHDEILGAWIAKESVRDVYLVDNWREPRTLLYKPIAGCLADDVPEIVSLGNALKRWRPEILAHQFTGASNGPAEGLNLCIKSDDTAATASKPSSTTDSASYSTPVASSGPTTPHQNPQPLLKRAEPKALVRVLRCLRGRDSDQQGVVTDRVLMLLGRDPGTPS